MYAWYRSSWPRTFERALQVKVPKSEVRISDFWINLSLFEVMFGVGAAAVKTHTNYLTRCGFCLRMCGVRVGVSIPGGGDRALPRSGDVILRPKNPTKKTEKTANKSC